MKNNFDVVIVGAGMVGATVACSLGDSDIKVAVIEQRLPQEFKPDQCHDLRVSALSIASKNILAGVGAWSGIINRRFCPFKRMRVWETAGDTEFNSADINHSELGFIVENRIIQLALLERLSQYKNIELIAPTSIKKINYVGFSEPTIIELDNGDELQTTLLVAADGGHSKIRQTTGLGVSGWDYQQHALVVYVETAYEQQDITWQHFLPSGPQAFLPLNGHYASLVWYHSADEIRRLKNLANKDLIVELTAAFPDCLGEVKQVLGIASFSLKHQHAQRYVKTGVVLVGDAAHIINPLAGQGVNIGLLDSAALGEVLINAKANTENLGDMTVLKRYEKMRRNENLKMMAVMDILYRAFSNDVLPVKFIRNFGLGLVNRILPAKNKLMRLAMGLEGNLPKLARGKPLH